MHDTPSLEHDSLVLLQTMLVCILSESTSWQDLKIYKGHILFVFFIPLDLENFLWKHLQYTDGILDTLQQSPDITAILF